MAPGGVRTALTIHLAGRLVASQLVVTGIDLTGHPVSLSEPVPSGALLSGPGPSPTIGAAIALAAHLADLKPGGQRHLTALRLDLYPIAVTQVRYDIERKPDAAGDRVFAVLARDRSSSTSGELVLDAAGNVISQTRAPPLSVRFTQRL